MNQAIINITKKQLFRDLFKRIYNLKSYIQFVSLRILFDIKQDSRF